jgi:hypothetical protein
MNKAAKIEYPGNTVFLQSEMNRITKKRLNKVKLKKARKLILQFTVPQPRSGSK